MVHNHTESISGFWQKHKNWIDQSGFVPMLLPHHVCRNNSSGHGCHHWWKPKPLHIKIHLCWTCVEWRYQLGKTATSNRSLDRLKWSGEILWCRSTVSHNLSNTKKSQWWELWVENLSWESLLNVFLCGKVLIWSNLVKGDKSHVIFLLLFYFHSLFYTNCLQIENVLEFLSHFQLFS